jgi:hypothetical protein
MDDSDDYGYDDFVLDEQTLAALDQAEQHYQNSLLKPSGRSEPVNKRHKTETGWKAGSGAHYVDKDDFDDLPEISVRGDGSYSIRTTTTKQNAIPRPNTKETISTVPSGGSSSSSMHHPPRYRDSKPLIPQSRPTIHSKTVVQSQEAINKSNEHFVSELGQPSQLEKRFKELQKNLEEVSDTPLFFQHPSRLRRRRTIHRSRTSTSTLRSVQSMSRSIKSFPLIPISLLPLPNSPPHHSRSSQKRTVRLTQHTVYC